MSVSKLLRSMIAAGCVLILGCSSKPPARIAEYLGSAVQSGNGITPNLRSISDGEVQAGLLLINDTSHPDSAPALSEQARAFLTNQVRQRLEEKTPIRVTHVLPADGITPTADPQVISRVGQGQGVPYVLLAVFSGAESEIPMMLPLTGDPEQGGQRPKVLGFEAISYALAELALLDSTSGQVVAKSDGRAWSRLNRLNVPVKSNAYPVIHRSLRVAPIYPTEDNAKDVLRSIAGDEALEQAVHQLQVAWANPS